MTQKMVDVEVTQDELVVRFRPPRASLPPETRAHMLNAGKEFLLALRTMLDAAIETCEKAAEERPKTRSKIRVE